MPPKGKQPKSHNKYAPTAWGQGEPLVDLTCPSGQVCQVRLPGIPGLIKAGLLSSLDSLSGLVQTEHIDPVEAETLPPSQRSASKVTPAQVAMLAQNSDKLVDVLGLVDKVICYVVLQPTLNPVPEPTRDEEDNEIPAEERKPGLVYVDSVELTDKMFIFQFVVGGVSDLQTFRAEFGEALGSLEAGESLQMSSLGGLSH